MSRVPREDSTWKMASPESCELETLDKLTIALPKPQRGRAESTMISQSQTSTREGLSLTQSMVNYTISAMDNPSVRFLGNWLNWLCDHSNTTATLPIPLLSFKGEAEPRLFSLLCSSIPTRPPGNESQSSRPPFLGITLEAWEGTEILPQTKRYAN